MKIRILKIIARNKRFYSNNKTIINMISSIMMDYFNIPVLRYPFIIFGVTELL
jgi:hypothetical protein